MGKYYDGSEKNTGENKKPTVKSVASKIVKTMGVLGSIAIVLLGRSAKNK